MSHNSAEVHWTQDSLHIVPRHCQRHNAWFRILYFALVLSPSLSAQCELSKRSLSFSHYGEIEIISEVKIPFDGMVWTNFKMPKNTLKIRQMKRYCDKFNKLDIELGIWIISRRSWKIKRPFWRGLIWFVDIFSNARIWPKKYSPEVEEKNLSNILRDQPKNFFNSISP